jgi:HAMP domain-containing protein
MDNIEKGKIIGRLNYLKKDFTNNSTEISELEGKLNRILDSETLKLDQ